MATPPPLLLPPPVEEGGVGLPWPLVADVLPLFEEVDAAGVAVAVGLVSAAVALVSFGALACAVLAVPDVGALAFEALVVEALEPPLLRRRERLFLAA